MDIAAERRLDAGSGVVWAALNDIAIVRRSLPGCQELSACGEGRFDAAVRVRVGGNAAVIRLVGSVTVTRCDPPNGCRLAFASHSAAVDSGSGNVRLLLQPHGDGTLVRCEIDATLGGRLAEEHDAAEIEEAVQAFAAGFLRRLAAQTTLPDPLLVQPPRAAAAGVRSGLKPGAWVPTLIALIVLMLAFFARLGAA